MNGTRLNVLKPAPREGRGVALGVAFGLSLHPVAWVVIALVGTSIDRENGAMLLLPFLVYAGFTQWIYLGPVAWWLRRHGWSAAAKGVVIAGAVVTIANVLLFGGAGLVSLQQEAEVQRILREEREHPTDLISTDGVVTVVDDTHFEFRREDDGTVVSLLTWEGLDYVFLRKDGGYEDVTRDILKPGVRVAVDYFQDRGKPPLSASIVRVYEDGARR
jgi:hypothetical protein